MKTKKILSLVLAGVMALALAVPALADDTQSAGEGQNTEVPVMIEAQATTFSVTVPTEFPTAVDPDGGNIPIDAKIINNSTGAVYVSNITVKNYAKTDGTDAENAKVTWYLDAYDGDLRNMDVDSNHIGVSVTPSGGRAQTAKGNGHAIQTTDASTTEQELLNTKNDEWVIDATDGADGGSDELSVTYATNATPVSGYFNGQVATIVIVVAWNK